MKEIGEIVVVVIIAGAFFALYQYLTTAIYILIG